MRLYIIRHADPDYPNNTITPAGHLEAEALAPRMQQIDPDRLYVSPLGRARDTARYTEALLGKTAQVEEWCAELSDCRLTLEPWGDLVMWDVPGEAIRASAAPQTPANWHETPCFSKPFFKERLAQLARDSDAFLARHGFVREGGRYRIERASREKIAIFCHGGLGLCWLSHLLDIAPPLMWAGFWLPPSSITTVLFDERSPRHAVPRCIGVGDVSHLYAAGLPVAPAGIKANAD